MVTDEILLRDINNTELESRAYEMIAEGFNILADLPENAGTNSSIYHTKAGNYLDKLNGCNELLIKLRRIKMGRGL